MKSIVLVSIIVLIAVKYSEQEKELTPKEQAIFDECVNITKIDPELANKALSMEFTDNKDLKCFLKCNMVKSGVMTESGQILADNLKKECSNTEELTETQVNQIVDACKNSKGTDPCDTAYVFAKCTLEQAAKIIV